MQLHYQIQGSDLQYLEITLEPKQAFTSEQGAMMYVESGINVSAILGDGTSSSWGIIGRFFKAIKRSFTGESMFSNHYINTSNEPKRIHIAAPSPGKIIPIALADFGGSIICQKGAYLAGNDNISIKLAFQKRLRVGFFGGEGFIMQKISGSGIVFIHASGSITCETIPAGQQLIVDSGCLVGLAPTVRYDIKYTGSLKTSLFGGEGFFFATVSGPGQVWIQSLPFKRLAHNIFRGIAKSGSSSSSIGRLYLIAIVIFVIISLFIDN